ncbi:GrpB family protein [Curtobacterium sp. MCBD17_034]|uniref:GrpB family protein n=1 Tax=unclassified Curtobacterium TaxID=257496 RepID=UPI000DA8561D|nr:GrpB family protein [Curtobacterium sp. MCBD17_034]PZM32823.1 GrpB family protein [Curtobacterium sp. MCBD17_031]
MGVPTTAEILDFDEPPVPAGASPWVVPPKATVISVVDPDPEWPQLASTVSNLIIDALDVRALRVEHVGSTSVPGLAAKPVLDLDLTVADPSDERVWLPRLESAGFVLTVREPWWHEHRLLQGAPASNRAAAPVPGIPVNLHVFGPDSPELVKHVVFRNWLRHDTADRERYATVKRQAAQQPAQRMSDYNARKAAVIREIYERALAAAGFIEGD